MPTQEEKHCPRCGDAFVCIAADVEITADIKDFLAKTNYDCLCNKCLMELNTLLKVAKNASLPPPSAMVEGLHYYIESGSLVFTEYYHILRGYCCNSGCRHCPYGFKNKK